MSTVTVNGSEHPIGDAMTVEELVAQVAPSPKGVAVAVDRSVIPRSEWSTTALVAGSVVEIVSAAAGG